MCAYTCRSVHSYIQLACYCKTRVYLEIKVAPKTLPKTNFLLLKQWFSADDFLTQNSKKSYCYTLTKRIFFFNSKTCITYHSRPGILLSFGDTGVNIKSWHSRELCCCWGRLMWPQWSGWVQSTVCKKKGWWPQCWETWALTVFPSVTNLGKSHVSSASVSLLENRTALGDLWSPFRLHQAALEFKDWLLPNFCYPVVLYSIPCEVLCRHMTSNTSIVRFHIYIKWLFKARISH